MEGSTTLVLPSSCMDRARGDGGEGVACVRGGVIAKAVKGCESGDGCGDVDRGTRGMQGRFRD